MSRRDTSRRHARDVAEARAKALTWRRFRKALAGALAAGLASVAPQLPALLMGADLASSEGLARLALVVASMVIGGALVYRVPNAQAPPEDTDA